jgi:hypothetical protein
VICGKLVDERVSSSSSSCVSNGSARDTFGTLRSSVSDRSRGSRAAAVLRQCWELMLSRWEQAASLLAKQQQQQ